ncbi:MAG: hypothetical protein DI539_12150 [Flavobacterium psychrophilum]|nr:MAG: hypothetical protein DI539_12150 [Flavobacterium psychrophilum]
MKTKLKLLGAVVSGSILLVFFIYFHSRPDSSLKKGFARKLSSRQVQLLYSLRLNSSNYHFAGVADKGIYISSDRTPAVLLKVNGKVIDTMTLDLSLASGLTIGELIVDTPYFYAADMLNYIIYRGQLVNQKLTETIHARKFFAKYVPHDSGTVVLRTFTEDKQAFRLQKERNGVPINAEGLLTKQVDGLFCTDGMLRTDPTTGRVVYIYFYRNEFLCIDYSMKLLFQGKTIDTTSVVKIKVSKNKQDGSSRLSSPPFIVNRAATCDNGKLYVNSKLKGDNETMDVFRLNDAIDVYSLSDGSYEGSFYLSHTGGQRLRYFIIRGNICYVLSEQTLYTYQLHREVRD